MQVSIYHRVLRVCAVVLALVLLFVSGLISERTAEMAQHTHWYLANAVGVSVGVEETELNRITAALTQREQDLARREAAIAQREIDVGIVSGDGTVGSVLDSTLILSVLLFIMLVLIILNYVLDFLRGRRLEQYEISTYSHR